MLELLSPAGNMEKLKTVLYFGADAVYLSGKSYGLRAFGDNFDKDELDDAIKIVHAAGKKAYVTVNIFAHDCDFAEIEDYLKYLSAISVDAIIVSDPGVLSLAKKIAPSLKLHLSTQANTTNKYSAAFWAECGVERIVLARELSITEIRKVREYLPKEVMLEAFVHGAMCMAYSGRCLLSNYLAGRPSNRGECSQSCRWEYALTESKRPGEYFKIEEDERGSYILNSKDLNMLEHIDKLIDAGIESFKIEGRVKSAYYAATVTGAYRKALDAVIKGKPLTADILSEPYKTSHRNFTTGFYFGGESMQTFQTSRPEQSYEFSAVVTTKFNGYVAVEMRNRFKVGDVLEIVSPRNFHNNELVIEKMCDTSGKEVTDALNVQQTLYIYTDIELCQGDMLRKKCSNQ